MKTAILSTRRRRVTARLASLRGTPLGALPVVVVEVPDVRRRLFLLLFLRWRELILTTL